MSHAPSWVFAILAALVVIGLLQTRPRSVSRARLLLMPMIIAAVSLLAVLQLLGPRPIALLFWLLGATVAVHRRRWLSASAEASFSASRELFLIAGSWLPLGLLMALFALRFIATGSLVRHPELVEHVFYVAAIGLGFGLIAGAFVARSLLIFGKASGPDQTLVE